MPLTGGTGIAFMVVIAALLGTAGVIVVVRSRRNATV
ncbi:MULTISPECIES: LPXTG cell wall anchor domain-containing protein [Bifidobacterium]